MQFLACSSFKFLVKFLVWGDEIGQGIIFLISLSGSSLLVQRITHDLAVLLIYFLAMQLSMSDLSPLTEGQTQTPLQWMCRIFTTGLPGKSLNSLYSFDSCFGVVLHGKLEFRHLTVSVPSGPSSSPKAWWVLFLR